MEDNTQTQDGPRKRIGEILASKITESEAQDSALDQAVIENLEATASFDAKRKTFSGGLAKRVAAAVQAQQRGLQ
jgi:hypothetical protein